MVKRSTRKANINLRFNILTVLIYVVGIILIAKLFSLQIIHGAEYREQSNTRIYGNYLMIDFKLKDRNDTNTNNVMIEDVNFNISAI